MELSSYLRIARKYWVSIVACTLLGLLLAGIVSLLTKPTYTAQSSLYLSIQNANSSSDLAQGASYTSAQVKSFALVADSPVVLQPVIDKLGLKTSASGLAAKSSVTVPTNTSILDISVVDTSPTQARDIANEIAANLVTAVDNMAPKNANGGSTVKASVIQPAVTPSAKTTPKVPLNLAIGLLLGLFAGVGQALLRHALDRRIRTSKDIQQLTDVPIVGRVAAGVGTEHGQIVTLTDPQSPRAEEYRRIRTNLQFLGTGENAHCIAVSSAIAGEGKTSTTLNLAYALAASGRKVLLVDADLRRPRIAPRLNLEGGVGLSTLLIGRAHIDDVVQPAGDNLDVIASGQVPPNPSELLGSARMAELVREFGERYDNVLIDSAPIVPVTDTAVLSHLLGGVLLVCASGDVDREQVAGAIQSVEATGGKVVGIVLNKMRKQDATYGSKHYYGHYGDKVSASGDDAASDGANGGATAVVPAKVTA